MAASAGAADGVLIVQKVTPAGGTATTHQIQIDQHRMRADIGGAMSAGQTVIFDGTKQVMYIVNDTNKTYNEITKADMDAVSAQMNAAMAQVPPEMRKKMEDAMRGRGAAMGGGSKIEYRKTGTGTVGKWTCDKYEGYQDGQKTIDMCTVDPKVLGFGLQDFAVSKDFAEFAKAMPGNIQAFTIGTGDPQGFSGVPVQSVMTVAGKTITTEMTDVKRQSFADSVFQPPAGYTQQASPFGAMRGRRGGGE
jgi:hypothetical protein